MQARSSDGADTPGNGSRDDQGVGVPLKAAEEPILKGLAKLAAQMCHTPMAMIEFVDASGQRAVIGFGWGDTSLPQIDSLQTESDPQARFLTASDTLQDPRFLDLPWVMGDPYIRFLATISLRGTGGNLLGTLCVMDQMPRALTAMVLDALQMLGRQVVYALELRQSVDQLKAQLIAREAEKQLAIELREAKDAAEASTRVKSEFLANMSHEIRTPMTAILGYADMLGDEAELSPAAQSAVATIKRNSRFLLDIVNDILDISKIEAGKVVLERIGCSLREIVEDVRTLIRMRADAKNLPFAVEYQGALPARIMTDPTRLRQILINLTDNAVKFTPAGEVKVVVRMLELDPANPLIEFAVSDTGIGMSPQQISHLYRPFSQGDSTTTRSFGGTGLGLAISKQLAKMLGGDISVVSKQGSGTTFRVTVSTGPLESKEFVDAPPTASSTPRETSPAPDVITSPLDLQGRRILVAEDGPDNQRLIAFVLKKAGAEAQIAKNGQIACEMYSAADEAGSPFDAILMDMQMPVLDGYSATRRLRDEGVSRPIIALTAHAMSGDREKCLAAGCDEYATKPINRSTLLATIGRSIRIWESAASQGRHPARLVSRAPVESAV